MLVFGKEFLQRLRLQEHAGAVLDPVEIALLDHSAVHQRQHQAVHQRVTEWLDQIQRQRRTPAVGLMQEPEIGVEPRAFRERVYRGGADGSRLRLTIIE